MQGPVDPCAACQTASTCRLKLNCGRYLKYKDAQQKQEEDREGLRRCQSLALSPGPPLPSVKAKWEQAAREHPWRPAAEETMAAKQKIDPARARQLYAEGLTDLAMAECLGVTRQAVALWRKKQGLATNSKAAAQRKPAAEKPVMDDRKEGKPVKRIYVQIAEDKSCLLVGDRLEHTDDNNYVKVYAGQEPVGIFDLSKIMYTYMTEPAEKKA